MTTEKPDLSTVNPVFRYVYRAKGNFDVLKCSNREMLRQALREIGLAARTRELRHDRHQALKALVHQIEFQRQLVEYPQLTPGRLMALPERCRVGAANADDHPDRHRHPKPAYARPDNKGTPTTPPPYFRPINVISDILSAYEVTSMAVWPNLIDCNFNVFEDLPELQQTYFDITRQPLQGIIVTDEIADEIERQLLAAQKLTTDDLREEPMTRFTAKFNQPDFKFRTTMARMLYIRGIIDGGVRIYTASPPH